MARWAKTWLRLPGSVYLKPGAKIGQDTVAVMGAVTADPKTKIGGDAVSVGGKLDLAKGSKVQGQKVNVGLPFPFLNGGDWLAKWLQYCMLEFRPLAATSRFCVDYCRRVLSVLPVRCGGISAARASVR